MSVSKNLRYEILRRDHYACRYCGGVAPDVKLTVDHVMPVALGGSDKADNLVAACDACNAGKSASSPGAPLVDDVAQDALRWAQALQWAAYKQLQSSDEFSLYCDEVENAWESCSPRGLPDDWQESCRNWWLAGCEMHVIIDSIEQTMGTSGVRDPWSYMAGLVWKSLRDKQGLACTYLKTSAMEG